MADLPVATRHEYRRQCALVVSPREVAFRKPQVRLNTVR